MPLICPFFYAANLTKEESTILEASENCLESRCALYGRHFNECSIYSAEESRLFLDDIRKEIIGIKDLIRNSESE